MLVSDQPPPLPPATLRKSIPLSWTRVSFDRVSLFISLFFTDILLSVLPISESAVEKLGEHTRFWALCCTAVHTFHALPVLSFTTEENKFPAIE